MNSNSTIAFQSIGLRSLKHSWDRCRAKETEARDSNILPNNFNLGSEDRETNSPQGSLFKRSSLVRYSLGPVSPGISPGKQRDDVLLSCPRLNSPISAGFREPF